VASGRVHSGCHVAPSQGRSLGKIRENIKIKETVHVIEYKYQRETSNGKNLGRKPPENGARQSSYAVAMMNQTVLAKKTRGYPVSKILYN
jgi:hypothetical protein